MGPFDNHTTADFAGDLDEAGSEERETMIRGELKGAADPTNYLDASEWEQAVASAAHGCRTAP
ncbi:DUF4259 domain-containing protein [Streptomyces sp. NPDC048350]|uniref:DUF4259 domain-containing protein n=1 Tax=Streptomyces sp. NPDC048350 TaxID=3365538 RepID=UPI003721F7AA